MKRMTFLWVLLGMGVPALLLAVETYRVSGSIEYSAASPLGQWTGINSSVTGSVSMSPTGGKICVDQAAWDSKNRKRDEHTKTMFNVAASPQACLVVSSVDGNTTGGSVTLRGKLTMNGVTRDVSIPGTLSAKGGSLHLEGSMDLRLTDYQIERPSVMGVQVKDDVHVKIMADGGRQ